MPATVPLVPSVDVDGRSFFYERRGAGAPLLLIMGLSGNSLHWGEPFLGLLERSYDVVAFDNRGIGRSAAADADFSVADMADDTAGMMAALGWERAHVMGISMGGMIAQELALRSPALIGGLVLGCTYPGGEGSRLTDQEVVQALAEPVMRGDRDGALRAGWNVNVSEAYGADEEAFERFREVAAQHPASLQVLVRQMQAVAGHDALARLAGITAPTLVIHGDRDRMLDVANGRLIAEAIPGAHLEVLEGVGHLFFWEQPERSAKLVCDFLTAVPAAA